MTTRSTRRVVSLAIACVWLACASSPVRAAPAQAATAPASAPVAQSAAAASAETQYTVKPGQSLADIAAEVTQSHDKTVLGRAARSIFDANPSAFMRNDPSLLKLGAVLNVPALDATGAVAKAEPAAAAAPGSASNAAPAGIAASQAAASGPKAGGVPSSKSLSASAPAATVSPTPASAATGVSAAAKATPPAAGIASNPAAASAPAAAAHPQTNGAAGGHAWSGAIEPAPVAPSSATAPAPTSATAASGAAAVSSVAAGSAPAAAASGAPASAAASIAAPASASSSVAQSTPKPGLETAPAAASAGGASHPKVSSLQQLLTLKNRVLMELQRHGFGGSSAGHPSAAASAPTSASAFAAAPASRAAVTPAPGNSRAAAAANQRFIGVGGHGISFERNAIPAVAAIVAAVVAALIVMLVALGVSRRRRRVAPAAGSALGAASGAASALPGDESARTSAMKVPGADDPIEAEFLAILARAPSSKRALMGLAGHYAERRNVPGFDEIAQRIYRLSGGRGPNWTHVASIGRQLDPDNPLFALPAGETGEAALSPADEAGVPGASVPELDTVAQPSEDPTSTEATVPRATDLPPAAEPAPSDAILPEPHAGHSVDDVAAKAPQPEDAQAGRSELPEPAISPEPETAAAPEGDATLPPEAIAALDGLDIGLPPRVKSATESPVFLTEMHPDEPELDEPELEEHEGHEGPVSQPPAGADMHVAPTPLHDEHAEQAEDAEHAEHGESTAAPSRPATAVPASPEARPAVTGLGAAPVGRLNLSFDLDLPDGQAGEGEPSDIASTPQFTPEQLARIARNKLDLAAEYIALGDLGGARTLIHEVIESNDAATHDEAHAMLATLAPLS